MSKEKFSYSKLAKDIEWNRIFIGLVPAIATNPLVITGIWLLLSKRFTQINRLNTVIALSELVPAIDLNLPPGVTLGAMIDKSEDTIQFYNMIRSGQIVSGITFPEIPSKEEVEKELGTVFDQIVDFVAPTVEEAKGFEFDPRKWKL